VTQDGVTESDTVTISVDVANDGARAGRGDGVLFTHDKLASVARPLLELKGFGKIQTRAGRVGHGDAARWRPRNCASSDSTCSRYSSPARWRFWWVRARIDRGSSRERFT
jgi:hypothetical protein